MEVCLEVLQLDVGRVHSLRQGPGQGTERRQPVEPLAELGSGSAGGAAGVAPDLALAAQLRARCTAARIASWPGQQATGAAGGLGWPPKEASFGSPPPLTALVRFLLFPGRWSPS